MAATRAQLRRLMDDTREEANALLRDIHQLVAQFRTGEYDGGDPKEALRRAEEMRRRTIKLRDRAEGYLEAKQDEIVPPREEGEMPGEENVVAEDLRPGQHVRVISLDRPGHILETNEEDGDAEVQIGVVRMRLPLSDLEPTEAPEEQENRMRLGEIARMKGETLSERLNIRQHTVEEALPRLAKYLDDVLLAGGNHATILHGRGTGTLRDAVRDYLEKHPQVESWRPGHGSEGGDGITVALLR